MATVFTTYTEAKTNGFVGTRAQWKSMRSRLEARDALTEQDRVIVVRAKRRRRLQRPL